MQRIRMLVRENRIAPTALTEDDYRVALEPPSRTWVVEDDEKIVGFASADSATGNIWALFVHPDFERRGYGRMLHDAMVDWCWDQGSARLWLTTDPGTRADGFYLTAGWTPVGRTADNEILFERMRPDESDGAGRARETNVGGN